MSDSATFQVKLNARPFYVQLGATSGGAASASTIAARDAAVSAVSVAQAASADAQAAEDIATAKAGEAETSQQAASRSETNAGLSALLAQTASPRYADTASGIAATTNGQYFVVVGSGDVYASLYRNNSGTAVFVTSVASKAALDAAIAALSAVSDWFATNVSGVDSPFTVRAEGVNLIEIRDDGGDLTGYVRFGGLEFMPDIIRAQYSRDPNMVFDVDAEIYDANDNLLARLSAFRVFLESDEPKVDFTPSAALLNRLGAGVAVPDGMFDGDDAVAEPNLQTAYWDDGVIGLAPYVWNAVVGSNTALLRTKARLLRTTSQRGQSNSVFGGMTTGVLVGARAVTTTAPYPHQALMFSDTAHSGYGTVLSEGAVLDPATLPDLVPAVESVDFGETHGPSLMRHAINRARALGLGDRVRWYGSHGQGGRNIYEINKGTQPFANELIGLRKLKYIAQLYGFDGIECVTAPVSQGEEDRSDGTLYSTYLAYILQFAIDTDVEYRKITEQTTKVWTVWDQLVAPDGALSTGASDISVAQFDAQTLSNRFVLSCSPYFLRSAKGYINPGTVHWMPIAKAILGEYQGEAETIIDCAMRLNPQANLGDTVSGLGALLGDPGNDVFEVGLRPDVAHATRIGTTITIPLLGRELSSLAIDTTNVADAGTGKGFAYSGSAINGVALSGHNIIVTLATSIAGTLTYARDSLVQTADGSPNSWGNIRDGRNVDSVADPGRKLWNWLPVHKIAFA